MCGKGMSPTSSQTATPNPAASQAYNAALAQLGAVTSKPFQRYSSDPTAYVSPLTQTQTGAIQNISGMAGMTDPYYQAAAGLTAAGAGPVGRLTGAQIGEYMSPYMSQVIDPVTAAMQQQFGRQQAQQQAQAIKSGAFGGSRANIERAVLRGQQDLALGQALSPLYQTGYGQAQQTALGQQGIEAQNQQRMLMAGQQFGGLGSAAQQAALQQAQAQLQGGTLEQQTRNAMLQALYGEAQKERMYPLQAAQIYAQGAAALGPLMGSTQSTSQQLPFFGGLASGGAVDAYNEGLGRARMGGAVHEGGDYARGGYAYGGEPDLTGLVEQQRAALGLGMPKEDIQVPIMNITASKPLEPGPAPQRQKGIVEQGLGAAMKDPVGTYEGGEKLYKSGQKAYEGLKNYFGGDKSVSSGVSPREAMSNWDLNFAGGGSVGDSEDDAMQKLASTPIQASKPITPESPDQNDKGKGLLGTLLKTGASMAANYFAPGSGAIVSSGLGALGLAHGGRAGYATDGGVRPDDNDLFDRGILGAESGRRQFDRDGRVLTSPKGALGIAQILESTAPEAAKLAGIPYDPERLRSDEKYNASLGRAYYNEQLRRFGTPELAAAAYNAGPGRVQQALRRAEATGRDVMSFLPAETRDYVPRVMRMGGMGGEGGLGAARPLAFAGPEGKPSSSALDAIAAHTHAVQDNANPSAEEMSGAVPPGDTRGLGSARVKDEGFLERTEKHPESLILPVLKGLGAMAGSRSKYLGSALLEGLGAGAGSYMDMAAQQAAMDKVRQETATEAGRTKYEENLAQKVLGETGLLGAQTEKEYADIAGSAFKDVDGRTMMRYFDPATKTYQMITFQEWNAMDPARRPAIDPRVLRDARSIEDRGAAAPSPTPGGAEAPPATTTAPSPAGMPEEPEIQAPTSISVTPEVGKYAYRLAMNRAGWSRDARKDIPDLFTPQVALAKGAEEQKQQLIPLIGALASLPTEKSIMTSGKQQEILNPLVSYLAGMARTFGAEDWVLSKLGANPEMLTNANEVQKFVNQLQQTATQNNQLHAFGAFKEMAEGIPGLLNTPGAQRRLASQLLTANQRQIDKNAFFTDWRRAASGRRGESSEFARLTSPEANKFFDDNYSNAFYAPHKENIAKVFDVRVPMQNGRGSMSLAEVMARYPNKLTPEFKAHLEQQYPGILRYFGIR